MGGTALSRRRKVALLALAAAHLGLVATVGVLHVDLGKNAAGRAVMYYGDLSGANTAYSFFAPSFDAVPWAVFQVTENGVTSTDALETWVSHEADVRIRNAISIFSIVDDEWKGALAASLAGKMFARHPDAEAVVTQIVSYALPTMEDCRKGALADWALVYEARLAPRAREEP
jgi:hypothetical protein